MTFIVYKVANLINQKVYVGKTNSLPRRTREHWSEATRCRRNSHLYSAIRKYGVANFSFTVVGEFSDESTAYAEEVRLIAELNSMDRELGYNLTPGGEGVRVTEVERKRRSDLGKSRTGSRNPFFGKRHTRETKNAISESAKKRVGPLHSMWGRQQSPTTRAKISRAKLGKPRWSEKQRIEIGKRFAGDNSCTAKITNAQAVTLRKLFAEGVPAKELQDIYGLSKTSVWRVINRLTFREV